jgi:hypothetical protein
LFRLNTHLPNQLSQIVNLLPQLPYLHHSRINLDIRFRALDLLAPAFALPINFALQLLPLLRSVIILFIPLPIKFHMVCLARLDERRYQQQRSVDEAHDIVIQPLISFGVHPPLEGDDQDEHLD